MKKQRNISIELLRIVAMLMIVMGHAFTHGHALDNIETSGVIEAIIVGIKTVVLPGTNIFVLISGYFLAKTPWSTKRVVEIYIQIVFYSFAIYIIFCLTGLVNFGWVNLLKYLLPVSFNTYWFMRVYIYLVLCSPFLNKMIGSLNEREHRLLILLGFVLMVIPASIPVISVFNPEAGNGILWFMMLYITGAYFSNYEPKHKVSTYNLVALGCFLIAWSSQIFITSFSFRLGFGGMGASRFSTFDSFPIFILSVCLLCIAIKYRNIEYSSGVRKTVLFFSGSTAGIYMIHEHPVIRHYLWQKLSLEYSNFAQTIIFVLLIFAVSAVINNLTWKQFAKIVMK